MNTDRSSSNPCPSDVAEDSTWINMMDGPTNGNRHHRNGYHHCYGARAATNQCAQSRFNLDLWISSSGSKSLDENDVCVPQPTSASSPVPKPSFDENAPLLSSRGGGHALLELFDPPPLSSPSRTTTTTCSNGNCSPKHSSPLRSKPFPTSGSDNRLPSIHEYSVDGISRNDQKRSDSNELFKNRIKRAVQWIKTEICKSSTWIGSCMFLLYHVVFCLTMGSSITRTHSTVSMFGVFTKAASVGIVFSAPIYWITLGDDIPALYPTVDLFTAPFFARMAVIVEEALQARNASGVLLVSEHDQDMTFLTTFFLVISISLILSSVLLSLASVFKLADLASFLPTSVIAGFFSSVAVMMWTLSVKIDAGGRTIEQLVASRDWNLIQNALLHHVPSLALAGSMKLLGPLNPFWVMWLVFGTILIFHGTRLLCGLSMNDMAAKGWFWSEEDLVYAGDQISTADYSVLANWTTPVPLGWLHTAFAGYIHWPCVWRCLKTCFAFACLYLIRCSVHGAAIRKNVTSLQREVEVPVVVQTDDVSTKPQLLKSKHRKFSEVVDIEPEPALLNEAIRVVEIERPPNTQHSMKDLLFQYSIGQFVSALVGGFAVVPSVAVSATLYKLHAENVAPQIGSVLLLGLFYVTDFRLVLLIPKPAFSALLILAFIDMTLSWLIDSYSKTKEKLEWLVVPLIVVFAFMVGLLEAVFLGLSFSTFFFVAAFFRSGVVKFLATGLSVRSTIERPCDASRWLDQNGELIQVIVLQNYLFFGNASSILNYVFSMFEETKNNQDELLLPPFPMIVILDLALVSGVDGSAVDIISDIVAVCRLKRCKLFLSGVSPRIRETMALRGLKPEEKINRSARLLRFFSNLDAAVGKAEDLLLDVKDIDAYSISRRPKDSGFSHALRIIDAQHNTSFQGELVSLESYTTIVELQPGDVLINNQNIDRGLFFIEEGTLKIDRQADTTLTRSGSSELRFATLDEYKARNSMAGRQLIDLTSRKAGRTFRVARVGPGWVLGTIEAVSGLINPGSTIAVDTCRLHYLSFSSLEVIETTNSQLALKLYKLLALLVAKRQEITISHLAMLHTIMASSALTKPVKRNEVQSGRLCLMGHSM